MTIVTVGSINIDHVYGVDHFVRPGETMASSSFEIFAGGKGFNQSIALARAGAAVRHVGRIGPGREWLLDSLKGEGVDTEYITIGDDPTGHAIIQVVPSGENAIILHSGANHAIGEGDIDRALAECAPGDWLLTQNETSTVAYAISRAKERGLKVAFNPAPMSDAVKAYPLDLVDLFILNETEAEALTGLGNPDQACTQMGEAYPDAATIITLGVKGALYAKEGKTICQPSTEVDAVDTTAAGDTFIGYFLAELMTSNDPRAALAQGCLAAALCVTRPGAADSIPSQEEVQSSSNGLTRNQEL
jgi:ribokinase